MDPGDLLGGLEGLPPCWARLDLPHRELLDGLHGRAVDDMRRSADVHAAAAALRTIDVAAICGVAAEGMSRLRAQLLRCLAEAGASTYGLDLGRDGRSSQLIRAEATVDRIARANLAFPCEIMVAGKKHAVTLRVVTTDADLGADHVAVAGVCPGVTSQGKRVLIPHIEARVRSLPDRMLDAVELEAVELEAGDKRVATGGTDRVLTGDVVRSCRLALARTPAAERGGEAVLGVVRFLEVVLAARPQRARELLEEVERFKACLGLTVTSRGRADAVRTALAQAKESLRQLAGRSVHATVRRCIGEAERSLADCDLAAVTRALGTAFAELEEFAPTDAGAQDIAGELTAQIVAALRGPLGAQILDKEDQHLRAFLRQAEWQQSSAPMDGKPRGHFVRLLRPGVALGPWCLVPPRIEVSRAQRGRVHRFLDDVEELTRAGAGSDATLAPAIGAVAAMLQDRDGPALESDARVLREVFACFGSRYERLEPSIRDRLVSFLGEVFGAVIERPAVGASAVLSRHHAVEWQPDDAPRGQVLRLVSVGLDCPRLDVTIPAQVQVSRGPPVGHPFLLRLRQGVADLPAGLQDPVRHLLQAATDAFGDLLATDETRVATLGRAMDLADLMAGGGFADHAALRAELLAFLTEHGCHRIPTDDQVLPLSQLARSDRCDVVLRFDPERMAGAIVKVLTPGWEMNGSVCRRARVEVALGPEPGVARVHARALELAQRTQGLDPELLAAAKAVYQTHIAPVADWYARALGDGHVELRVRHGMVLLLRAYEAIAARSTAAQQEEWNQVLEHLVEVLVEHGFDVQPRRGSSRPGLVATRVFHDSVPPGGIVRIARRAVIDERGEVPRDDAGMTLVSAGPCPRFLARLRDIERRTGPLPGLDALELAAAEAVQQAGRLTVEFCRERVAAFAAIVDRVEQAQRDQPLAIANELSAWLGDVFRSLGEYGVEVAPTTAARALRYPAFDAMFETGAGTVVYGDGADGVPRSFPVSVQRRAWSVDGSVIIRGRIVVSGGDGNRFTRQLETLLSRPQSRRAAVAGSLARLSALDDEALFHEVRGQAVDTVTSERCTTALAILDAIQGDGMAPGLRGVVEELMVAIRAEFGVDFLPAAATAASIASAKTDRDNVEVGFGSEERGLVEVRRYGWQYAGRRVPFVARVFLGAPPAWYVAFRADFADLLSAGNSDSVCTVLERSVCPDQAAHDPEATTDNLARAYAAICGLRVTKAEVAGRRLLAFMRTHFGVQVYPEDDAVFDANDSQWAGAEIEVVLDPAAPRDFVIMAHRIQRRGLRTPSGRVLLQPRFAVSRRAFPQLATRLIAITDPHLAALGPLGAEVARQLRLLRLNAGPEPDRELVHSELTQALLAARRESRLGGPGGRDAVRKLWSALAPSLPGLPAWDTLELEQPYGAILDCIRELAEYPTEQLAPWARRALSKGDRIARLRERVLDYEKILLDRSDAATSRRREEVMQTAIDCINVLYSCQSDLFLDAQSNERDIGFLWTFLEEHVFDIEMGLAREFQVTGTKPSDRGAIDLRLFYEPERRSRAGGFPRALIQNAALLVIKPCYQQKRDDGERTVQTGRLVRID